MKIYVDADACSVKQEVLKVALRYRLPVIFVANSWMRLPEQAETRLVVVEGRDINAADDWIAENVLKEDIVITADIPLAARCIKIGARVLGQTGKVFTESNIGQLLATRDLMSQLREAGTMTGGGPQPFSKADRSRFLHSLDLMIQQKKPL